MPEESRIMICYMLHTDVAADAESTHLDVDVGVCD